MRLTATDTDTEVANGPHVHGKKVSNKEKTIAKRPPHHGRLQSRKSPPKILGLYWGPFCYFFSRWGSFGYVSLIMRGGGAFSLCERLFTTFFLWGAFWACPFPYENYEKTFHNDKIGLQNGEKDGKKTTLLKKVPNI